MPKGGSVFCDDYLSYILMQSFSESEACHSPASQLALQISCPQDYIVAIMLTQILHDSMVLGTTFMHALQVLYQQSHLSQTPLFSFKGNLKCQEINSLKVSYHSHLLLSLKTKQEELTFLPKEKNRQFINKSLNKKQQQ